MTVDTSDLGRNEFHSTFPAGAAHAACEVDDYDGAAPEGAAIASLWLLATVWIIGLALWMVFA